MNNNNNDNNDGDGESAQEKESCKILCDFTAQTDKVLEHRRLDIVSLDKVKRECVVLDFAVPGDQNVTTK